MNFDFNACVVNCFQNTILVWNSQVVSFIVLPHLCCELLSEYYLSMEFTGLLRTHSHVR